MGNKQKGWRKSKFVDGARGGKTHKKDAKIGRPYTLRSGNKFNDTSVRPVWPTKDGETVLEVQFTYRGRRYYGYLPFKPEWVHCPGLA